MKLVNVIALCRLFCHQIIYELWWNPWHKCGCTYQLLTGNVVTLMSLHRDLCLIAIVIFFALYKFHEYSCCKSNTWLLPVVITRLLRGIHLSINFIYPFIGSYPREIIQYVCVFIKRKHSTICPFKRSTYELVRLYVIAIQPMFFFYYWWQIVQYMKPRMNAISYS